LENIYPEERGIDCVTKQLKGGHRIFPEKDVLRLKGSELLLSKMSSSWANLLSKSLENGLPDAGEKENEEKGFGTPNRLTKETVDLREIAQRKNQKLRCGTRICAARPEKKYCGKSGQTTTSSCGELGSKSHQKGTNKTQLSVPVERGISQ